MTESRSLTSLPASAGVQRSVENLKDHPCDLRRRAARELGELGSGAVIAVPELAAALSDPDKFVRVEAALALLRVGPEAQGAVPELRRALADEFYLVRGVAGAALGKIGAEAREAIPELVANLDDAERIPRTGAIKGLAGIGPAAVAALIKASREGTDRAQQAAEVALNRLDGIIFDERDADGDPVSLLLDGPSIDDLALGFLASLTSVTRLVILLDARITDAGIQHLAAWKELEYLQINLTGITDLGLVHLGQLTQLKELHLERTRVTAEAVGKLRMALPGCEIFHDAFG